MSILGKIFNYKNKRFADHHHLDNFYLEFENKFRGNKEDIENKVVFYAELLKRQDIDYTSYPIVDIGCGRGELLSILKRYSLNSYGIDINHKMVDHVKSIGLDAKQSDAVTLFNKKPASSIGAVTGMQIIEHIPFDELISLFTATYRVLCKGGVAIFETPNPENINVGTYSFYMDPSHLSPLPPPLIEYALKNVGFDEVEILYQNADERSKKKYKDPMLQELSNRLYGPRDYAVVAKKAKA